MSNGFSKKAGKTKPVRLQLPINYETCNWVVRKQARDQYCEDQGGMCWYCGSCLLELPARHIQGRSVNKKLFPKSMFDYPIHLHHCHKTGMTIGAVHAKCNAVLWQHHGE